MWSTETILATRVLRTWRKRCVTLAAQLVQLDLGSPVLCSAHGRHSLPNVWSGKSSRCHIKPSIHCKAHVTPKCSNAYTKGKRSFEVLGQLDPATLSTYLPSLVRVRRILDASLKSATDRRV